MATANEEEEPDYMSDIFIVEEPINSTTNRNRSSKTTSSVTTKNSQLKRLQKGKRKEREIKKSITKELEAQVRQEGLSKPLSADNKGYSLLCKMGYVQGETLGKSGGLVDPLPLTVKEGRLGLGRDEYVKDIQEKTTIAKEKQLNDYRSHCLSVSALRRLKSDLKKSRQASEHLDTQNGYTEPVSYWYWLSTLQISREEEENEEEEEPLPSEEEQLSILTEYLRSEYYYCLWCGMEYSSEEELLRECPGDNWQAHEQ